MSRVPRSSFPPPSLVSSPQFLSSSAASRHSPSPVPRPLAQRPEPARTESWRLGEQSQSTKQGQRLAPQRVMEPDGEPSNPPQGPHPNGAAAVCNSQRCPISNGSRIEKKLKGESWIMELDNLYHIAHVAIQYLQILISFSVSSCKHKEIFQCCFWARTDQWYCRRRWQ